MNFFDCLSTLDITLLVIVCTLGSVPLYHLITGTGPTLAQLNSDQKINDFG